MKIQNKSQNNSLNIKNNSGFTLLEISIGFVIVALIAVGIVKGADLIDAYKNQNVIKQYIEYKTAFNTFKEKYGYMPGDFPNAESYWPGASNGNGDGIISSPDFSSAETWYNTYLEGIYAWNHLANEGLVQGFLDAGKGLNCYDRGIDSSKRPYVGPQISGSCASYANVNGNSGDIVKGWALTPGVNAPNGPYDKSSWIPTFRERVDSGFMEHTKQVYPAGNADKWISPGYNALLILGDYSYRNDNWNRAEGSEINMKCTQEIGIDYKIDDGKPYTGNIQVCQPSCVQGSVVDGVTAPGRYECWYIAQILKGEASLPSRPNTLPENWSYKPLNQLSRDSTCGGVECVDFSPRFVLEEVTSDYSPFW